MNVRKPKVLSRGERSRLKRCSGLGRLQPARRDASRLAWHYVAHIDKLACHVSEHAGPASERCSCSLAELAAAQPDRPQCPWCIIASPVSSACHISSRPSLLCALKAEPDHGLTVTNGDGRSASIELAAKARSLTDRLSVTVRNELQDSSWATAQSMCMTVGMSASGVFVSVTRLRLAMTCARRQHVQS